MEQMRPGLIQLEIGVQSTNPETLAAIHRTMDFSRVREMVSRVRNLQRVHQHLDLIAGLPFEDYESFARSFNEVYALSPGPAAAGIPESSERVFYGGAYTRIRLSVPCP